jgi:uncharacterized protein YndB with AHSA1/START domain
MEKELTLERIVNAPIDRVWQAWTTPEELKKWWGPDNVTIPECELELQVGGKIYIVMEAGEAMGPYKGILWPMLGEFTVVQPNEQLSYKVEAWTEGDKEETTIDQGTEISFAEVDGKTKVTVHAIIYKTGPKAKMAVEGMEMGFTQQFAKLQKYLEV